MIVADGQYRMKLTPPFDICVKKRELNGSETETIDNRKCKSEKKKISE